MPNQRRSKTEKTGTSLTGKGTIHVLLTMDMRRWIHENSLRKFLALRYSDEYSYFLQGLRDKIDNSKFIFDNETRQLEQIGNDLNVFGTYVYENLFMPTYKLMDNAPTTFHSVTEDSSKSDVFREQWNEWPVKRIRLSRGGTITVKLEQKIEKNIHLVDVATKVLGLEIIEPEKAEEELPEALADEQKFDQWVKRYAPLRRKPRGIQWMIADEVVRQFLDSINLNEMNLDKAKEVAIQRHPHLQKNPDEKLALAWYDKKYPTNGFFLNINPSGKEAPSLRDRYIIFEFSNISDPKKPAVPLTPTEIKQNPIYCKNISSMLEGVAINIYGTETELANYKSEKAVEFLDRQDLATWENELCLLTLDNGLVYYTDQSKILFSNRDVEHGEYWSSIIRGIEHLMEIRVQTQMVARETSEKLAQTVDFNRILGNNEPSQKSREIEALEKRIRQFGVDKSYLARMAGYLRNWSSPVSISKADFAEAKFESWLGASHIERMLDSTDKNMQDINAFLSHYDDTQLQLDSQSTNDMTLLMTVAFSLITVLLSFLSLPSFIADLGRGEIPTLIPGFNILIAHTLAYIGISLAIISFVLALTGATISSMRIWNAWRQRGRGLFRKR